MKKKFSQTGASLVPSSIGCIATIYRLCQPPPSTSQCLSARKDALIHEQFEQNLWQPLEQKLRYMRHLINLILSSKGATSGRDRGIWCAAKHYTRENCLYTIESLRTTIPAAFRSILSATINKFCYHCVRTIEAYASGFTYGTKSFQEQVHKNHRQVPDASKW